MDYQSRTYQLPKNITVQNLAYALAEFLDVKKNLITQTMRTGNGYTVQCKGDATMEWTKYIGMDAAISVRLMEVENALVVNVAAEKWMEKLGIAALGTFFFQPLLITTGLGALRQIALPLEIYSFIEEYLGQKPVMESTREMGHTCSHCGAQNPVGAVYCKQCGQELKEEIKDCPYCGHDLRGDEVFCPYCGEELK